MNAASLETRCDAMLLGKLGHELAHVYRDTLNAPMPAPLRALIERLEAALGQDESADAAVARSAGRPR